MVEFLGINKFLHYLVKTISGNQREAGLRWRNLNVEYLIGLLIVRIQTKHLDRIPHAQKEIPLYFRCRSNRKSGYAFGILFIMNNSSSTNFSYYFNTKSFMVF